jgi:hypothetical protein
MWRFASTASRRKRALGAASVQEQAVDGRGWKRAIDSPLDIAEPSPEIPLVTLDYEVGPRSVVILVCAARNERCGALSAHV